MGEPSSRKQAQIAALDARAKDRYPDAWQRIHAVGKNKSKRRSQLRKRMLAEDAYNVWREANPEAKCLTCVQREYAHNTWVCGLGYETGGWYQPVKDDYHCMNWKKAKDA